MTFEPTDRPGIQVYRLLRRAIIEQALLPGTRLPEDTVGDQFGVSRTVVRQALVRLETESLVVTRLNRGAFVAEPSLEEARQVFELRHCLEREVIRLLCEGLPRDGIDVLESHVREEEHVEGKDGPVSIRLAGEFHILLAELTGNTVLARYVSELVTRCSLILASHRRVHSSDCAVDEHRQVIESLRAQDADETMRIMRDHLGAVADRAELAEPAPRDLESVLSRYHKELAAT